MRTQPHAYALADSDVFPAPPPEIEAALSRDGLMVTWWLLLHVAPLSGVDARGDYDATSVKVRRAGAGVQCKNVSC